MLLTMKKAFLANPRNKQKFLYFIANELEKAGVELYHSAGDADYDIVSTTCTMAKRRSVAVFGVRHRSAGPAAAPSQSETSCHLPTDSQQDPQHPDPKRSSRP